MKRDSNPRELIGVVTLSSGSQIEVRMPITGDIIMANLKGINQFEAVVTSATNLSYEEFCNLPLPDGAAIMDKLNIAFEAIQKYMNNSNKLN